MNWKHIAKPSTISLNAAIVQMHHASQFLARFSHAYLERKPDDSHNNFDWDGQALIGRALESPAFQIKLDLQAFELIVQHEGEESTIKLPGLDRFKIEAQLKLLLKQTGLDEEDYREITHFTVPRDPLDDGEIYELPDKESTAVWSHCLSNAKGVLKEMASHFDWASDTRVWPHHFDMGTYITVTRDGDGNDTQSIGIGLAIADAYWNEPYFYINHWSKNPITYGEMKAITGRGRWNKKDWTGLILPLSDITDDKKDRQYEITRQFFEEGINITLQLLEKDPVESFSN